MFLCMLRRFSYLIKNTMLTQIGICGDAVSHVQMIPMNFGYKQFIGRKVSKCHVLRPNFFGGSSHAMRFHCCLIADRA